jgi:hypothetical protein
MSAFTRRIASACLLSVLVGVGGAATTMTTASATNADEGNTHHKPHSTAPAHQVRGKHITRYCVSGYKPNSTVTVTNGSTSKTYTIHTNAQGGGCVPVQVVPGCQTVAANGQQADGSAATSSSRICVLGETVRRSNGDLPFTGSGVTLPGILAGIVLVAVGAGLLTVAARRRRFA